MKMWVIFIMFPAVVIAGQAAKDSPQQHSQIKLPPINVNITPSAPATAPVPAPSDGGWSTFTATMVTTAAGALVTGGIGLYFHRRKKSRQPAAEG